MIFTMQYWGSKSGPSTLHLHKITTSALSSPCQEGQHSLTGNLKVSLLEAEDLLQQQGRREGNREGGTG